MICTILLRFLYLYQLVFFVVLCFSLKALLTNFHSVSPCEITAQAKSYTKLDGNVGRNVVVQLVPGIAAVQFRLWQLCGFVARAYAIH